MTIKLRPCLPADSAQLADIYNHYIRHTVITFEETPLQAAEMAERVMKVQQRYPWLVCEDDAGLVLGYAYASLWRERVALHTRMGFAKVAHFNEVGRKFGQWLDVGYWQRISPAPARPAEAPTG